MFHRRLLLFALACSLVAGDLVQVSLDDASANITYTGGWDTVSPDNPCTSCALRPDASQIYNQTWHDGQAQATGDRTITIEFNGVQIEPMFVLFDSIDSVTDLRFTLDGVDQSTDFQFPTSPTTGGSYGDAHFFYNMTVFTSPLISDGVHELVIVAQVNRTLTKTNMLFDRAIVMQQQPDAVDTTLTEFSTSVVQTTITDTVTVSTSSTSLSPSMSGTVGSDHNDAIKHTDLCLRGFFTALFSIVLYMIL